MTASYDYWKEREEKARNETIQDEDKYIEELEEIYKQMFDEIEKDINDFFVKYAKQEGISIAEAKKRVSKLDMEKYERKAKKYVAEKDFSEQANEEMRIYNLTMKINRLEMLKANIGLELVDGYQDLEDYLGRALNETVRKEIKRQAGILGETVGDNKKYADSIVNASFRNATWSERIWNNQEQLKQELHKTLSRGLIQGRNPREMARDLRKTREASVYDAERLLRTEMSRVRMDAKLRSIVDNGFTEFIFIAEPGSSRTCDVCKSLDKSIFKVSDGQVGINIPPIHPNCRCSIAGHVSDDALEEYFKEIGIELTDRDRKLLGLGEYGPYGKAGIKKPTSSNTGSSVESRKLNFTLNNQLFGDKYFKEKKEFQEKVLKGEVRLNTRIQKQNKHILGTNNYFKELEKAKGRQKDYPSYFKEINSYEVRNIFESYYGHGVMDRKKDGSIREFITVQGLQAYYYNNEKKAYVLTNRFMIKYSKRGVHVVPVAPLEKMED